MLSDVHMPVMDGYQMTRALRAGSSASRPPRTPIVALTAAALKGEAERCLAAGMDDYLVKPVSIPALAACLRKWLPHTAVPRAGAGLAPRCRRRTPRRGRCSPGVVEPSSPAATAGQAAACCATSWRPPHSDLAELHRALDAGDAAAMARQAHRIVRRRPAWSGRMELADAARALEQAARAADWALMLPACTDVQTGAERVRLHIEAEYLAPHPAPSGRLNPGPPGWGLEREFHDPRTVLRAFHERNAMAHFGRSAAETRMLNWPHEQEPDDHRTDRQQPAHPERARLAGCLHLGRQQLPVLTVEEEQALARPFRDDEDLDAAKSLVLSHLRFVVHVARGYQGYGLQHGRPDPGRQHRPDEGGQALRSRPRRAPGQLRRALDPRRDARVHPAQLAHRQGRHDQGAAQAVLQPAQVARSAWAG